jgi:tetratricopeptide (TPR) repeat protein
LASVDADIALARGRLVYARFLRQGSDPSRALTFFVRAAEQYRQLADVRGEGEALFWSGTFRQVVLQDNNAALHDLQRAHTLATLADDRMTLSCVVRHLGFAAITAGRMEDARERLEQSVQLCRELGFQPGVAVGLIALAELSLDTGDTEQAQRLLDEAADIAAASGADGAIRLIAETRLRMP